MAASTTLRPHSSSSSGSSTPWLSPEVSSSTWRGSYTTSADFSRRSSSGSANASPATMGAEPSSSRNPHSHSQEWWEHVLPPGQLAERLRKAQRSSSASRRRNTPALANATPSERSAWKRLSGLPAGNHHHERSEASTANSSRRSSFQATAAPLPRSAFRSSHSSQHAASFNLGNLSQSESSAEVSSDEFPGTSTGRHSPQTRQHYPFLTGLAAFHDHGLSSRRVDLHTTSNTPEMASPSWSTTLSTSPPLPSAFDSSRTASRSAGGRRMRVMSEDSISSFLYASSQSSSSSSYRLRNSYSAVHLNQFATTSDNTSWSSAPPDRTRAKVAHHSFPDTPEFSSDEAPEATSSTTTNTTTTTQRTRTFSATKTTVRTSTCKVPSPPTILRTHFDRPDQPPCPLGPEDAEGPTSPGRRDRHVSFDPTTERPRRTSVHDYTEPTMSSSQSTFTFGSLPSREYTGPFDSLPPRSNSTRRARHGVRVSGRRASSFSLPGSRRGSIHEDSPFHFGAAATQASGPGHRRASSISDAVLVDSLNVAHKQLASAGNLALTLTRQLSAPLRPVFHMTLFLSISSITVVSLACFLCASYMLTAWDDVSKRTQKVGEVAGRTRHRFGKTLDWGFRMLGPNDAPSRTSSKSSEPCNGGVDGDADSEARSAHGAKASHGTASTRGEARTRGAVSAAGHAFLWPARMAWSGASIVAYRITPPTITKMFEEDQTNPKRKGSGFPPRPPLSTLVPSILFTLVLAIGAGLTSFLASRRAAAEARVAENQHDSASGAHPYTVPSYSSEAGMEYVHMARSPSASPFLGSRINTAFQSSRSNHADIPAWDARNRFAPRTPSSR